MSQPQLNFEQLSGQAAAKSCMPHFSRLAVRDKHASKAADRRAAVLQELQSRRFARREQKVDNQSVQRCFGVSVMLESTPAGTPSATPGCHRGCWRNRYGRCRTPAPSAKKNNQKCEMRDRKHACVHGVSPTHQASPQHAAPLSRAGAELILPETFLISCAGTPLAVRPASLAAAAALPAVPQPAAAAAAALPAAPLRRPLRRPAPRCGA